MRLTLPMKVMTGFAALAVLGAPPAFAESSVESTSTATAPSLLKNLNVLLSMDYYGAALADPGSSLMPDAKTGARDPGSPILTEDVIVADYKLSKTQKVGATYGADITPFREKGVTPLDLQVHYTAASLIKRGGFNFGTHIRAYLPTSKASSGATMITNLRWYQMASLAIPHSRLELDLTTYLRPYLYSDDAAAAKHKATRLYVYAGPQLAYQVTPKLQAWLLFEYLGTSKAGHSMLKLAPYTDLEPGLTWQITKKVSFTPYLDFKTSNRVALDTTTINANLTLTAL